MNTDIEAAAMDADRLADAMRADGTLAPLYTHLDAAIDELSSAGYTPADLLPATAEPGLGFSLRETRDGETLWRAIALAGRDAICSPDSEVRQSVGGTAGTSSIVAAVITVLGLPMIAVPIAATVTAFILAAGIDGFCRWSAAPADEPEPA